MKPKRLKVTTLKGDSFDVEIVPCSFIAFYEACAARTPETLLAERSVRLLDDQNRFERIVPPGWIDTLDDDSASAVVLASNELNISPDRVGKVAALVLDWRSRQRPAPSQVEEVSQPSSSSPSGSATSSS